MRFSDVLKATQEVRPDTNNTGSQELEIEYSFFAKVNVGELIAGFAQDPQITHEHFIEGNLTHDSKAGKMRLRHFPNSKSMPVTKLEMKEKIDLNKAVETSVDLPDSFLRPLLTLCKNVTARVRYYVPVKRSDGSVVKRRDETLLMWQVDFFINNLDPEEKLTTEAISEWVKIELEVDNDALTSDNVGQMIPFECLHLIDARSKDDSERNLIDSLYSTVYNLAGRGTLPEPSAPALPTPTDQPAEPNTPPAGTSDDDEDDDDFDSHLAKTGGAAPTQSVGSDDEEETAGQGEDKANEPKTPPSDDGVDPNNKDGDEFTFNQ